MPEQDLRDILANGHRVNDTFNIAGGLANVLNQEDATRTIHQMARLHRALANEVAALRADMTKLARHLLDSQIGAQD